MLNGYKESGATLFFSKLMRVMKKMKAELNEHRYYLEQMVEQRTAHLLKRIAVLESCNAALCDKLASVQQEAVALKQQPAHTLFDNDAELNDCAVKLCIINNQARKPVGSIVQDKWGEHVTAA